LLWVILTYTGVEYISVINGRLHLNYLPYSHSVLTSVVLALIAFTIVNQLYKNRQVAIAVAMAAMSHVILDILFHEQDINLTPFSSHPVFGLGITDYPYLNFVLVLLYGIFCWWYFKGYIKLLIRIIIFNLIDLPMMLGSGDAVKPFATNHFILPTIILIQILLTWYFVWRYSRTMGSVQGDVKLPATAI
jgi:hypothetical protein